MKTSPMLRIGLQLSLLTFAIAVVGCGQNAETEDSPKASVPSNKAHDHAAHDHGGWWCTEHGIPEEDCSMCSSKAAAKFKEKGDWCEKHSRAKSQCFICDPLRAEKYAKLYEAKFGEKPPKPTE